MARLEDREVLIALVKEDKFGDEDYAIPKGGRRRGRKTPAGRVTRDRGGDGAAFEAKTLHPQAALDGGTQDFLFLAGLAGTTGLV